MYSYSRLWAQKNAILRDWGRTENGRTENGNNKNKQSGEEQSDRVKDRVNDKRGNEVNAKGSGEEMNIRGTERVNGNGKCEKGERKVRFMEKFKDGDKYSNVNKRGEEQIGE